jgi:crossover junction endodeoxyribonuclease RusA
VSRIQFFVPGHAYPQGSMVQSKHGGIHHSGGLPHAEWRRKVTAYAMEAKGQPSISGPMGIALSFYLKRPKNHYRTGKNAHLLTDAAPARPSSSPDLDKLIRSILDSLTDAQVWLDDGQVVFISATKWWDGDRPEGVEITVGPIVSPLRSPA